MTSANTLRADHPVVEAVRQLAGDVFRFAAHGGNRRDIPNERRLPRGSLRAHLDASPASHFLAWRGSSVALVGWQDAGGIMLAVAHRSTGSTFASPATDALGVLQIAALAGGWVSNIRDEPPVTGRTGIPSRLQSLVNQTPDQFPDPENQARATYAA